MKLYKYMSMSTFNSFAKSHSLRLTKSYSQNDPFEFKLSQNDLEKFLLSPEKQHEFEEFVNMSGCISMSGDKSNIYMWSHYSDNHRGVMAEFTFDENDPKSLFFGNANVWQGSHIENPTGFYYGHINYKKTRPFHNFNGDLNRVIETLYFCKSEDWDKEFEYRFIIPFTEVTEILLTRKGMNEISEIPVAGRLIEEIPGKDDNEIYRFKVTGLSISYLLGTGQCDVLHKIWRHEGPDCLFLLKMDIGKLSGLYFGCKSSTDDYFRENDVSDSDYFNGKFYSFFNEKINGFYQAYPDENEFRINFKPAEIIENTKS
ncbi:DUF2971 domain-containing protein [Erwinia piriflorinigrans]|uniref:DUF2971 domain-containing protein n=1 Tax=Erwinia piriflorinigrans CFBP 5888 TaxID=1161919 RepID=V5ZCC8_9GAMM|nr:DUF2971 domain-containing protein [Erwinia piriflorinigrans]CCG88930.1 hypothetical protein EPIR_3567 [Erwinia piriflorinigrans CFBP 5888]